MVGIPASGKTTYFRFLSGHFGLNLPIFYIPAPQSGFTLPLYGDLENEVILEETTYETTDPTDPEGSLEATTRYYVNRPMEDRKRLWVELAAGREEQGVLTKYPLPTKYNQFVEMKMHFRYGNPERRACPRGRWSSRPSTRRAGSSPTTSPTTGSGSTPPTARYRRRPAGSSPASTPGVLTVASSGAMALPCWGGSSTRPRG